MKWDFDRWAETYDKDVSRKTGYTGIIKRFLNSSRRKQKGSWLISAAAREIF